MTIPGALKEQPQFGVGQFDALAAFNGLLGLRFAWGTTFGLTLPNIDKALAQLSGGGGLGTGGSNAGQRNIFGNSGLAMLEQIGHGLTHTESAAADKWVTEAWAFDGIGAVIERIAEDVVRQQKETVLKTQPRHAIRAVQPSIRQQVRPAVQAAAHAEARARAAEHRAAELEQRVAHLERTALASGDGIVVGLPPRVGLGEREREQIKAGLRKVSKYGTLAFFLALLAKALEKMGASWIRCRNVRRYGRQLCGMDSLLLDSLLAGSLVLTSVVSLKEFARMMIVVTEETKGQIFHGFKETRELFG